MTDNRFKKGHYEDALQFAKDILSSSSSIDEIMMKANIEKDEEQDMKEKFRKN